MENGNSRYLYSEESPAESTEFIHPNLIRRDANLRRQTVADEILDAHHEISSAFIRKVELFVLRKLQERGMDDARELEAELVGLDEHNPRQPYTHNLLSLPGHFDSKRVPDENPEQQAVYDRLGATATAAAGIAGYEITRRLETDRTLQAYSAAEEKIAACWLDLPEDTHDKLVGLLTELRAGRHD